MSGFQSTCRAYFDEVDALAWQDIVSTFADASLYQSWAYETGRSRSTRVVHMVLERDQKIVAAAQARLIGPCAAGLGVAYVRWGPLWRPNGSPPDPDVLRQALRFLRVELCRRRRLALRVYPLSFRDGDLGVSECFRTAGLTPLREGPTERTLIMDLRASIDELRASLRQKWRNCLNKAERSGMEAVCQEDDSAFAAMEGLYRQMARRKNLSDASKVGWLRAVQKSLSPRDKLQVVLCWGNGRPVAGAIVSAMGSTGLYLVGATSDEGMGSNGSYLVQWKVVEWLHQRGFPYYDLNGINPVTNPGTYRFKVGLAGKRGADREFLGRYQVADAALSALAVKCSQWGVHALRRVQRAIRG